MILHFRYIVVKGKEDIKPFPRQHGWFAAKIYKPLRAVVNLRGCDASENFTMLLDLIAYPNCIFDNEKKQELSIQTTAYRVHGDTTDS